MLNDQSAGPEASPADLQQQQPQSAPTPQPQQQRTDYSNQQNANSDAENEAPEQPKFEEYELEIPHEEGVDISLYRDATKALAKDLGLSKEAAQKVIERDLAMKVEGERRIHALIEEQKESWANETRADKEIGGQNLERSLGDARAVLDRFGTPAFTKQINESGYGNNAELIRLLSRVGKAMREDGFVQAQGPARDSKKIADLMYPSMSAQQQ